MLGNQAAAAVAKAERGWESWHLSALCGRGLADGPVELEITLT